MSFQQMNLMMMMMTMMMTIEWPKLTVCCFCAFVEVQLNETGTVQPATHHRKETVAELCQRSL